MNTVWDVPREQWPNFVFRRVRAVGMLAAFGTLSIASTFVSGYAAATVHGRSVAVLAWLAAFALNAVLFVVAFRVLTAQPLTWREVAPGAIGAALGWTVLQNLGGYYVSHELTSASDVYGTFALVIALLVWISLGAQMVLLCAEANVVLSRRLWPLSLVQPPINEGDQKVYEAIVERARMRPEVAVKVWFTRNHDKGGRGRSGADTTQR